MKIQTYLISGAGNTFHIVFDKNSEEKYSALPVEIKKKIAREQCKNKTADGFIFLFQSPGSDNNGSYEWSFYNNDGSDAEMCGNATRCVGYYIKNILKSELKSWSLNTAAGKIKIEIVENEKFNITMTPVIELKSTLGFYCDTGVPHLVIEKSSLDINDELKTEARKLRHHPSFLPRGTNVTFVALEQDKTKLSAVSYERGVEGFTAACGTGAMAAAFYNLTKRGVKQTQVEMPGGTLIMDLSNLESPKMTGPAVLLGSYEYEVRV